MGLSLTLALLVRPVKRRIASTVPQSRPQSPTSQAPAVEEFFSTDRPTGDVSPSPRAVEEESSVVGNDQSPTVAVAQWPTSEVTAVEELFATDSRAEDLSPSFEEEPPAVEVPVEHDAPANDDAA